MIWTLQCQNRNRAGSQMFAVRTWELGVLYKPWIAPGPRSWELGKFGGAWIPAWWGWGRLCEQHQTLFTKKGLHKKTSWHLVSEQRNFFFFPRMCSGWDLGADLRITLVEKAMLNSFSALRGQRLGRVPSVQGCSAWGWSSSCSYGEPIQRCGTIQDKDTLLLSFPVTGKSIGPDRCSVRGLRPLFTMLPKVFIKGCRLKLLLQSLKILHILQGGLSGQQVDYFDFGHRQNENF